jgi:hypothetical protein
MVVKQKFISLNVICILSILTLAYALFFSFFSYDEIATWYQSLDPNFYKNDVWISLFFTPETYSFARMYSWVLVFLSFVMLFIQYHYAQSSELKSLSIKTQLPSITHIVIFLASMAIWWYWQDKAAYATDEVFSAFNFAAKPFFQTISHYPLPNNHIFFNALNHWFGFVTNDLVFTGRIISGLAMAILMVSIYTFSDRFVHNKWLRFAIIMVLWSVFPIFGFATQARGYGLHVLFSWLAFVHLFDYSQQKDAKHLTYYVLYMVLGLWTMPSFLYIWVGLSMPLIVEMVLRPKLDLAYIFATLKILWCTLILYLPAVSFSGWRSILANKYVASGEESMTTFVHKFFTESYFQGLFNEWFGTGTLTWIGFVIVCIPILFAIFYRKHPTMILVGYMLSLSISFIIMAILMKKYPFYRNLISHCLMFWVILLILISYFIETKIKPYTYLLLGLMIAVNYLFYTDQCSTFSIPIILL